MHIFDSFLEELSSGFFSAICSLIRCGLSSSSRFSGELTFFCSSGSLTAESSVLVCSEDLGDEEFGLFFGEDRGEDFDVCGGDAVNKPSMVCGVRKDFVVFSLNCILFSDFESSVY